MKRRNWESYILLNDAGMLSNRKRKALDKAFAADPGLREYRDQLHWTRQVVQSGETETAVSEFTMERIKAEAARALERGVPGQRMGFKDTFLAQWRPAVIYAGISVLFLLFGVMLIFQVPSDPSQPYAEAPVQEEPVPILAEEWDWLFEEELMELEQALNQLHLELDETAWLADENDMEEWARELLYLEGS